MTKFFSKIVFLKKYLLFDFSWQFYTWCTKVSILSQNMRIWPKNCLKALYKRLRQLVFCFMRKKKQNAKILQSTKFGSFLSQNTFFRLFFFWPPSFFGRKQTNSQKKFCRPPEKTKIVTKKIYMKLQWKLTTKFEKVDPPHRAL